MGAIMTARGAAITAIKKFGVIVMMKSLSWIIVIFLFIGPSFAWDGTDKDGNFVEIDRGERVRRGNDIEIYHSERGYGTYTVEDIRRYGRSVEIDVYSHETGEYETFEMDE